MKRRKRRSVEALIGVIQDTKKSLETAVKADLNDLNSLFKRFLYLDDTPAAWHCGRNTNPARC